MKRVLLALVVLSVLSVSAFAMETYKFSYIGDGGSFFDVPGVNVFVDVDSYNATQISFNFRNDSTVDSAVKTIAIEDNQYLSAIASIDNHTGVNFTSPANPPNFGGAVPAFVELQALSANANSPSGLNKNGIDKGESLLILANLKGGKTYADVINGLDSEGFRIGIHVGSLSVSNYPESIKGFDKKTPPTVPVPAAAVLAMIGIGCVTSLRKKLA